MKPLAIFDNLGPYHLARSRALAGLCDLTVVELYARSHEYAWARGQDAGLRVVTLNRGSEGRPDHRALERALSQVGPDALLVPGWSSSHALASLRWSSANGCPAILLSDSQEIDHPRGPLKEAVKRRIVSLFGGALVGGKAHLDYVRSLGMPGDRIETRYDVVDNRHFQAGAGAEAARAGAHRRPPGLPGRYLLASARFIPKKNLPRLIEAFGLYRQAAAGTRSGPEPWDLVLLGDGPLRAELEGIIRAKGLSAAVHLPGFRQYPDLPAFYGLADAFVHASTSEQWGLVVNEAMASGLPVLVSDRCGCAPDLVQDGENGFAFDPHRPEAMADLILRLGRLGGEELARMGRRSAQRIASYSPEDFARNACRLAGRVLSAPRTRRPGLADRALLSGLIAARGRG